MFVPEPLSLVTHIPKQYNCFYSFWTVTKNNTNNELNNSYNSTSSRTLPVVQREELYVAVALRRKDLKNTTKLYHLLRGDAVVCSVWQRWRSWLYSVFSILLPSTNSKDLLAKANDKASLSYILNFLFLFTETLDQKIFNTKKSDGFSVPCWHSAGLQLAL